MIVAYFPWLWWNLSKLVDIDIADPISIGQHKWLIADEFAHSLDPPTRLCIQPGIEQMDSPIFAVCIVDLDLSIAQADSQAA